MIIKIHRDLLLDPGNRMEEVDKLHDNRKNVQTFLDGTNGYLIRHNGFDDVFCMLGAVFEYKLPSKEDFISDAERRFQMLTDSIDVYTKVQ